MYFNRLVANDVTPTRTDEHFSQKEGGADVCRVRCRTLPTMYRVSGTEDFVSEFDPDTSERFDLTLTFSNVS